MVDLSVAPVEAEAPPARPSRNRDIEGLRAIAAFMVVMTHVAVNSTANRGSWGTWWSRMDVGVTVFFVLSGYLLYRPFARALLHDEPRPGFRRYARHRILRIVPAYWVVVLVSFLLAPAVGGAAAAAETRPDLWMIFRFLTFTQVFWKDSLAGPFPQAWSLSTELCFYLFLPLFAWVLARRPARDVAGRLRQQWVGLGVLVLIATTFRLFVVLTQAAYQADAAPGAYTQMKAWLPNHLDVFALGMGLALLSVQRDELGRHGGAARTLERWMRRPGASTVSWLVAFGFLAVAALGLGLDTTAITYTRVQELTRHWTYAGVAAFMVLPAVFGASRRGGIRTFLSIRPMVFLGTVSYGIYLWHVLVIGRWVSGVSWDGSPPLPARHPGQQFHVSIWGTLLWTVPITIVLATLTWYLVEKPAMRFKDKRLSPFAAGMWLIAGASFCVRLWSLAHVNPSNPDGGDPFWYHTQANLLADGKGFAEPFTWARTGEVVASAFHPPGFSLWLTPASSIGARGYLSHKFLAVIAGIAALVVIGLVAKRVAGPAAGLLAAGLTALYPHLWVWDGTLWPESLFALTIALVLLAAYSWIDRPSTRGSILLGLAVGAAVLTRGEAVLLIPLLVVPLCWSARSLAARDRLVQGAAMVGVAAALVAPWTVRNLVRFETAVPISSNSQEVLYAANCPDVYEGSLIGYWSFQCQQRVVAAEGYPPGDEAQRAAAWRREGVRFALDHKDRWRAVGVARVLRVWDLRHSETSITAMRYEGRDQGWSRAGLWAYRILLVLAVGGVVVALRHRLRIWPLLMMLAMVTLTALTAYGGIRFRTPGDLALVVLAGLALDALISRGRHRAVLTETDTPSRHADATPSPTAAAPSIHRLDPTEAPGG